jgi:hypothetical protein
MKFIISEKKRLPNVATTDIKNAKKTKGTYYSNNKF